jgi:hypothetical protein
VCGVRGGRVACSVWSARKCSLQCAACSAQREEPRVSRGVTGIGWGGGGYGSGGTGSSCAPRASCASTRCVPGRLLGPCGAWGGRGGGRQAAGRGSACRGLRPAHKRPAPWQAEEKGRLGRQPLHAECLTKRVQKWFGGPRGGPPRHRQRAGGSAAQ